MHRVQFVQIAHCELLEALLWFLLDERLEVLLGVLALLYLRLEYLLQLVNFFQCFWVALLVPLPLLLRFLLDLLLDCNIVVLQVAQCRLKLNRPFFGVDDSRGYQHAWISGMLVLDGGCCIDKIVPAGGWGDHTLSLLFPHATRLVVCRVTVDWVVIASALIVGGACQYFARRDTWATSLHHGRRLCLLELLLLLTAGLQGLSLLLRCRLSTACLLNHWSGVVYYLSIDGGFFFFQLIVKLLLLNC